MHILITIALLLSIIYLAKLIIMAIPFWFIAGMVTMVVLIAERIRVKNKKS